jgi:glycerol-3-phosphate dehydrogenase
MVLPIAWALSVDRAIGTMPASGVESESLAHMMGAARMRETAAELDGCRFDVIVIGGGIIGCGIARDAALRGLRVALVEQMDFGAGTSATSTRLVHGGLRYLEQFDFGLVRQDLAEREILLRIAPHLVKPLPFLVPIYRRGLFYRTKLRAGMILYDLLSYDRSLPGHRFLSAAETLALEPGLAADGLEGAALYYDAQVELTERLCVENVLDAVEHGAVALNHTRVTGLLRDSQGAVVGVAARETLSDASLQLWAPVVVAATGPWLDETLGLATGERPPVLRRTKGVHLVTPPVTRHAVVLFAEQDDRLFFVVPWLGYSFVGTTDTDFEGDPGQVRAEAEEVTYLANEVARVFPAAPWRRIFYTTAGVRALVRRDDVAAGAVSRRHLLRDYSAEGVPGLLAVLGGKITAYRDIAEEAVDAVGRRLAVHPPSRTRQRPLPGGSGYYPGLIDEARARARSFGAEPALGEHLVAVYGARSQEVMDLIAAEPRLAEPIEVGERDCLAQAHHAVICEGARTLADILLRRLTLGLTAGQGLASVERIAAEVAPLLGWTAEQIEAEVAAYRQLVARMREPADEWAVGSEQ